MYASKMIKEVDIRCHLSDRQFSVFQLLFLHFEGIGIPGLTAAGGHSGLHGYTSSS